MFLTKKSLIKIIVMGGCYFFIGCILIAFAIFIKNLGINSTSLFVLGIIFFPLDIFVIFSGRYTEGKGKLINLGNKLVRKELKPAEFLKEYERVRNDENLIVNKPCLEILTLVAIAYDSLDDRDNCLKTVDAMISVASEKKKTYTTLLKSAFLFSYGNTEEAEELFSHAQKSKLNLRCTALVNSILKSDRATAMGDYATFEIYGLKLLAQTFPKLDNLGKLITNYNLGDVYEKQQKNEQAILHYQYCVENGGETAMKTESMSAIERINNNLKGADMKLYRPVGEKEMQLIAESDYEKFPPRLPEQPIFYPVLNERYATEIAQEWNTKDKASGYKGYVTEFEVDDAYISNFKIQTVGASYHQELWIPAEELCEFNQHIIGKIKVIHIFK